MRTYEGLVLDERYRLKRLIATGGMGQVWEAVDTELDRECAVKILRDEYTGDEGYLERFRAEARHTAALAHPSICALYDYGEVGGSAFIVMELVPGRALSEIIDENPAGVSDERAIGILVQLANALDAAHRAGVVHRDVKPENLLVDDDDTVKITDFGIARSKDQARLTKTGLVMGTAQYLSPEQAIGKQATSLSDIYAFGIVAFELLAGHRPFTGASQVDIAMAQVKQKPPALPDHVGEDLQALVYACLAKKPADRPRSAASVSRTLTAIARGEHPPTRTGDVPRSPSPRPVASTSAGTPVPATSSGPSETKAIPVAAGESPRAASRTMSRPAVEPRERRRTQRPATRHTGTIVAVVVLLVVALVIVLVATGTLSDDSAGAAMAVATLGHSDTLISDDMAGLPTGPDDRTTT